MLLGASQSTEAIVFGGDDRFVVDHTKAPYNRVFRLYTGCTASLVGPSLLLTAAHCVSKEMVRKEGKISYFEEKSLSVTEDWNSPVVAYATSALIGTFNTDNFPDHDWAFVKIDTPLGEERGFFEIEDLLEDSEHYGRKDLIVPGFPGDRPQEGMLAHEGCSVLMRFPTAYFFRSDCDGWGGNSGAPFLIEKEEGDWKVVAVFAKALREYRWEVSIHHGNMGIPATRFIEKLKLANRLLGL